MEETEETILHRRYQLPSRQCTRKAVRTAALRKILEGTLFLIASQETEDDMVSVEYSKLDDMLIKLNQKKGIATNVIGQGPKKLMYNAEGNCCTSVLLAKDRSNQCASPKNRNQKCETVSLAPSWRAARTSNSRSNYLKISYLNKEKTPT